MPVSLKAAPRTGHWYPHYLPTAEQIAAECAAIRAGWSKTERKLRSPPAVRWMPPGTQDGRQVA